MADSESEPSRYFSPAVILLGQPNDSSGSLGVRGSGRSLGVLEPGLLEFLSVESRLCGFKFSEFESESPGRPRLHSSCRGTYSCLR
jgi:hypothetical protein